jgi:hypothetical protein
MKKYLIGFILGALVAIGVANFMPRVSANSDDNFVDLYASQTIYYGYNQRYSTTLSKYVDRYNGAVIYTVSNRDCPIAVVAPR